MASRSTPVVSEQAPAPQTEALTAEDRAARREAFNASIPRIGGASNPDAMADEGGIPLGGGSTPDPNDPAVLDPLAHLDDLPGVSETPPEPGEGLPETPPAPEPPPPEPPPPPAARETIHSHRKE